MRERMTYSTRWTGWPSRRAISPTVGSEDGLATLKAFGGPLMAAAGATVLDRMEQFSVVGFVEAIAKIPAHYALYRRTRAALRAGRCRDPRR